MPRGSHIWSTFSTLLLGAVVMGCTESQPQPPPVSTDVNTLDTSERNYRKVAEDLYVDESGEIYFRTVDVSTADANRHEKRGVYSYRPHVLFDTVIGGDSTYEVAAIRDRVDTSTFRRRPDDPAYPGYKLYEDSRHFYFLFPQADGGVLHISGEK